MISLFHRSLALVKSLTEHWLPMLRIQKRWVVCECRHDTSSKSQIRHDRSAHHSFAQTEFGTQNQHDDLPMHVARCAN